MKIPDFLKIGAHEYRVIQAPWWEDSDSGDLGQTCYEQQIIYIKAGMPESLTVTTLIHEVFHVINSQLDHTLLESLAEQLTQVFMDNGLLNEL